MRRKLLRRLPLHRLIRDSRGVSAVELGVLAPLLAMFVVGIGDLGMAFVDRFQLQQAIHRTLERAHQTGPVDGSYNYLVTEAAAAAGVPEEDVTLTTWMNCISDDGTVRAEDFGTGSCAPAGMNADGSEIPGEQLERYISLRIDCTYNPMFSGMPFVNRNADGSVPLSAEVSLRIQ